jgi:hypothetical protein
MLVTCMLAFVSALSLVPARAQADEPEPILWHVELDVVWEPSPYWTGTITTPEGDLVGSILLTENPATFHGITEHFDEDCTITTADGTVLKGHDLGVYNLKTFKFKANGWITEASSSAWEYLVGYKMNMGGTTTPLVIGGEVHATGMIMLVAP